MVTIAEARERKKRRLEKKRRIRQCEAKKKLQQKQRKPVRKISQKRKQLWYYKKTYSDHIGFPLDEMTSAFSWQPATDLHHVRWRRGKLYNDPYNMIPLTRDEHDFIHKHNNEEMKQWLSILARNHIENVQLYITGATTFKPMDISTAWENEVYEKECKRTKK